MPMNTRRSLGAAQRQQDWHSEPSVRAAKLTLKERVNAFFSYVSHQKLNDSSYKRWKSVLNTSISTWDMRVLLDIVKDIPLHTVRISSEQIAYKDRIEFLYPFVPSMESPTSETTTPPSLSTDKKKSPPKTPPSKFQLPTTLDDDKEDASIVTSPGTNPSYVTQASDSNTESPPGLKSPFQPKQKGQLTPNRLTFPTLDMVTPVTKISATVVPKPTETQDDDPVTPAKITQDADLNRDELKKLIKEVMQDVLKEQFQQYSDSTDKNIENKFKDIISNQMNPTIKQQVSKTFNNKVTDTIKAAVGEQLQNQVSSSIDELVTQKLESRTESFLYDLTVKYIHPKISTLVLDSIDNLKKYRDDCNESISERAHQECERIPRLFSQYRESINTTVTTAKRDIKQKCDDAFLQLGVETATNLKYIADETKDALLNLSEIAQDRTNQLKRTMNMEVLKAEQTICNICENQIDQTKAALETIPTSYQSATPVPSVPNPTSTFKNGDIAWYTQKPTSAPVLIKIESVHFDDQGTPFYTIEYPTGFQKQTIETNLSTSAKPLDSTTVCNRFREADTSWSHKQNLVNLADYEDDDEDEFQSPPPKSHIHTKQRNLPNAQHIPSESEIRSEGPSIWQRNQFQKLFRAKVESNDTMLVFYQQLQSQSAVYGIYLRELKHIQPDLDLCPDGVSDRARKVMAIALYTRLQDCDIVSSEYIEGQNYIAQYGSTSDGYSVLYQMIRLVHPNLIQGDKIYNLPLLSQAKNIFQYSAMCRNFILIQSIKKREYTEKERSELFLQNVDEDKYLAARNKCLTELDIATMKGENTVSVSNLKFENLPTTLQQYADKLSNHSVGFTPTVRVLDASNNHDNSSGIINAINKFQNRQRGRTNTKYPNRRSQYVAFQCIGCGGWGHKVTTCQNVPKVALCLQYIKDKPVYVQKLVDEYKRINNKATKKGIVRALLDQTSELSIDPEDYLSTHDVDIPMEDVEEIQQE